MRVRSPSRPTISAPVTAPTLSPLTTSSARSRGNELGPAADARRVARELELAHSSGAEGYRFEPYRAYQQLEDIAILTGGKAIAEDLGIKLENHKIDDMGKAKIAANAAGVIDPSKVVRSLQC